MYTITPYDITIKLIDMRFFAKKTLHHPSPTNELCPRPSRPVRDVGNHGGKTLSAPAQSVRVLLKLKWGFQWGIPKMDGL